MGEKRSGDGSDLSWWREGAGLSWFTLSNPFMILSTTAKFGFQSALRDGTSPFHLSHVSQLHFSWGLG